MWISLKDAAKKTGKAERTLRHYAAMGKIRVKKDGRLWLCDERSLKKYGFNYTSNIQNSEQATQTEKKNLKEDPQTIDDSKGKTKRYKTKKKLHDLGVYSELISLFKTMDSKANHTRNQTERALHCLGIGFYEFDREKKRHFFRLARRAVVRSLVFSQLYEELNEEQQAQIEESLLPGMSGLIRKMEKARSEKN